MKNRNIGFKVSLLVVLLFASALPVFACLCNPLSVSERVRLMKKEATVILVGEVSRVVPEDPLDPGRTLKVTIQPEKVWKSPMPFPKEYTVFTSHGCAVSFQTGSTYLVYAILENGHLVTDVCLGTSSVNLRKRDIRKLGKPIKTTEDRKGDSFMKLGIEKLRSRMRNCNSCDHGLVCKLPDGGFDV
ncbi:MAG TPA: hypothetical protein PKD24_16510 [Pyrinomonadaceae bacterium]|nr:hypothetical protein [Pyrinomonadaceae bacterium]HMP67005.1 hypothetical protein [Pyrinomonadaceae bacterium]